jgi:hypothetical protein
MCLSTKRARRKIESIQTLNKFFSSLSDFSFLSLNLVYELLKRSKSTSWRLQSAPGNSTAAL